MATFTFAEIFGTNVQFAAPPGAGEANLLINLFDFLDQANGGDLPESLGVSTPEDMTATQLFYAFVLMILKNQGESVNTNPTQKLFVADAGKTIATSTRDGQVKRSFTVSFFLDAGLAGTPSVDQIDGI
jgi:hypothetical protein